MIFIFYILIATFFWALSPVLIKHLTICYKPEIILLLRYSLVNLLFLPWMSSTFKRIITLPLSKIILIIFLMGAHIIAQVNCLTELPASWYFAFFALTPLISLFFLHVRLRKRDIIFSSIACFGVFLFVNLPELMRFPYPKAALLLSVSLMTWALLTVLIVEMKGTLSSLQTIIFLSWSALLTAIGYFLISHNFCQPFDWSSHFISKDFLIILLLSWSMVLALFLFTIVVQSKPVFGIVAQYLELIFGLFLSYWFFGERLNWHQSLGCILIVVGSLGVNCLNHRKNKQ